MYVCRTQCCGTKSGSVLEKQGTQGKEGAVLTNPAWRIKGRTSDGPARQETRLMLDTETRKETGSSVVLQIDERERQVNVSEVDGTDAVAN